MWCRNSVKGFWLHLLFALWSLIFLNEWKPRFTDFSSVCRDSEKSQWKLHFNDFPESPVCWCTRCRGLVPRLRPEKLRKIGGRSFLNGLLTNHKNELRRFVFISSFIPSQRTSAEMSTVSTHLDSASIILEKPVYFVKDLSRTRAAPEILEIYCRQPNNYHTKPY